MILLHLIVLLFNNSIQNLSMVKNYNFIFQWQKYPSSKMGGRVKSTEVIRFK